MIMTLPLAFIFLNYNILENSAYATSNLSGSGDYEYNLTLSKLLLLDPDQDKTSNVESDDKSSFRIQVTLNNRNDTTTEDYVLVMEARDSYGVSLALQFVKGIIQEGESKNATINWAPATSEKYQVRVFAISNFEKPQILSPVMSKNVIIAERAHCDESLWAHVWHPARLKIIKECITVKGFVTFTSVQEDGDQHLGIKLDPEFTYLINEQNIQHHNGALLTELICQNPTDNPSALAACKDFEHYINVPARGTYVRVTGTYILDTQHNSWAEIHPVTSITILEEPSTQ